MASKLYDKSLVQQFWWNEAEIEESADSSSRSSASCDVTNVQFFPQIERLGFLPARCSNEDTCASLVLKCGRLSGTGIVIEQVNDGRKSHLIVRSKASRKNLFKTKTCRYNHTGIKDI